VRFLALALLLAVIPDKAFAHSAAPGLEGLSQGFRHPFGLPYELLSLFALGLMMGQLRDADRKTQWTFAGGMAFGLLLAAMGWLTADMEIPLYIAALVAGLAVAIAAPLPLAIAGAFLAMAGIAIGVVSFPDPGTMDAMAETAAGAVVAAWALVFYVSEGVGYVLSRFDWPPVAIGVRIAGSWIAAISIFLIALAARH
jgi:hydrogenase/urease accessory protein HupE